MLKLVPPAVLSMLACAVVGCAPNYNLNVSLAPQVRDSIGDSEIQVHVIGVNPQDKSQFENMSVKSYWQSASGQSAREDKDAYREMHLTKGKPMESVPADDEIWKRWKERGVTELLVISSFPATSDISGNADPRRRFLSTNPARWASKEVLIDVTPTGLRTRTAMREAVRR